uniref:Uncharacterized protein n=1 Tax=Anguilla anguilla TaxID=7936 RepID=A0A0E9W031_ANGAN
MKRWYICWTTFKCIKFVLCKDI